nr:uncharacterized protein LOC117842330 [Setaria viridis]
MVASIPENDPQACRTMGLPSCPVVEINSCIGNLTSSYTEKSNEPSMVAASVIMFVLAGLFFNLNLFSGISDISAILDPQSELRIFVLRRRVKWLLILGQTSSTRHSFCCECLAREWKGYLLIL